MGVVKRQEAGFFWRRRRHLLAFDPKPGEEGDSTYLKRLEFDCNPPKEKSRNASHKSPRPEGPSEINANQSFTKTAFTLRGQDPSTAKVSACLTCLDPTKAGDITQTGASGSTTRSSQHLQRCRSTEHRPHVVGDFSGFGHVSMPRPAVYWVHDMKAHMWGVDARRGRQGLRRDEDGDFCGARRQQGKEILSETNLSASIYSTPVVANGVLYVATQERLYAFYDAARNAPKQRPAAQGGFEPQQTRRKRK